MRCFIVIHGAGAMLVASSFTSATHPILVQRLKANDINRMILMQVPEELVRERYPESYDRVSRIMGKDEFHVIDFNGSSVFNRFRFGEMGDPMLVEF